MTVSSAVSRTGPYSCNGVTTQFAYTFRILDEGDIEVVHTDANDVETILTITTEYTVAGVGDAGGGTVTTVATYPSGEKITLRRLMTLDQPTDLINQDAVQNEVHETAFDRLTMMAQQISEVVSRCASFPISQDSVNYALPAGEDGKVLSWSVVDGVLRLINSDTGGAYIPIQPSAPDPMKYPLWYDSANSVLKYWDGVTWQEPGSIDISGKQDRDTGATAGNMAKFDAAGHTVDAGAAFDDFIRQSANNQFDGTNNFAARPTIAGGVAALMSDIPGLNFDTNFVVYATPGTSSYVKPAGLSHVRVIVVGGGGGAGGAGSGSGTSGGGGGGGYAEAIVPAASLLASETVTVGAGGAGGANHTVNGGGGGASGFGAHCSASGGSGSLGASAGSGYGGAGGAVGLGDFGCEGNDGDNHIAGAGNGGNAGLFNGAGIGRDLSGNGMSAAGYGGGGSGGIDSGVRSGGSGYKGVVIVQEFYQ